MRILLVGAGGVGDAFCAIASRRRFVEHVTVADLDPVRAARVAARDGRYEPVALDASDAAAVEAAARAARGGRGVYAPDPRFVMPVFEGALAAGTHYMDMAMSVSRPHPERPYAEPGVKLGDLQFARTDAWEASGRLALCGMGVEPGIADVFARYAADELFTRVREVGIRDGADLTVEGYAFAPTFSIWTVIEECLNPPVVWERERGWYTTEPFSEPEVFRFPGGIGDVECVNVEHEEVLLVPRWIDCERVTFKYGLGDEFIAVLETLHKLGLDRTDPVSVRGTRVSPRDVVAACLPDPATLGDRIRGRTCAGTWVTGIGKGPDGTPTGEREVYLHHVVDNEDTMGRDGTQAVVWQTAVGPVVACELIDAGVWSGAGVVGPEALPPVPFLDLLAGEYDSPWELEERTPGAGAAR
jgi:saccharopine dehydrogenase-like NADP-dependent oxidoreductase